MIRILIAALLLALPLLAHAQTATGDQKSLSTSEQQKPADQPQMPVPGPTPQETSREGRPAERADGRKTEAQSPDTSAEKQSGSSTEPEKSPK